MPFHLTKKMKWIILFLATHINQQTHMIDTLKNKIKEQDTEAILVLLKEHPEILEMTDENNSTGFILLAYSGSSEAFEEAVKAKEKFTFHEAIVAGQYSIVEKQLAAEPDLVGEYSEDGFAPLSLAAFFDEMDIAKLLLEYDADPNLSAKNPSKVNALHSAVAKQNKELCELLIEKGVDVNAVQMQGVTALHSAAHRNNLPIVELLIEKGAELSPKMDNGDTPLAIAQREGSDEVSTYLKSKGAAE